MNADQGASIDEIDRRRAAEHFPARQCRVRYRHQSRRQRVDAHGAGLRFAEPITTRLGHAIFDRRAGMSERSRQYAANTAKSRQALRSEFNNGATPVEAKAPMLIMQKARVQQSRRCRSAADRQARSRRRSEMQYRRTRKYSRTKRRFAARPIPDGSRARSEVTLNVRFANDDSGRSAGADFVLMPPREQCSIGAADEGEPKRKPRENQAIGARADVKPSMKKIGDAGASRKTDSQVDANANKPRRSR